MTTRIPTKLQRDIRHERQHAGQGNGYRQPAVSITPGYKICKSYVTMTVTYRPQPRQHHHHVGVSDHGVWHREESQRPTAIEQGRHRDDRIGGIEIAADQKPCHPRPEASPRQSPLFERTHARLRFTPSSSPETSQRYQSKEETEDHQRRRMQLQSVTQVSEIYRTQKYEHLSARRAAPYNFRSRSRISSDRYRSTHTPPHPGHSASLSLFPCCAEPQAVRSPEPHAPLPRQRRGHTASSSAGSNLALSADR